MRKSETTAFYFYFFMSEDLHFVRENIRKTLVYIITFALPIFFTRQVIGNSVTPTPIQKFIGFIDAILRSKILENRLGFLTSILIMHYFFYLHISGIYFQFREKSILIWAINFIIKSIRKEIEILTKRLFSFPIIVFNMKFLVILFIRKSICQGKLFGSLHTSNRIYLLWNCFSNYVYLKDMYMSLKGIGKILIVSVLRILLICKNLNFTAAFAKKLKFPKLAFNFLCEKFNFSLTHRTHISIHSF